MLPIETKIPLLLKTLETNQNVVVTADPGAGKTTLIPKSLLNASWRGDGSIIVLEPRRLAARVAARRVAKLLEETVGETAGFRVRFENRISRKTRIEFVTNGIFIRMLLENPELQGVSAVIFDEFHERSLEIDTALALTCDCQTGLREDLKIVVMSATLDTENVRKILGDAPLIESKGRQFPVETRYVGKLPNMRLEEQMVQAVSKACREEEGSILCFLPGVAEIRRTEKLLHNKLPKNVHVHPLYGTMDGVSQDLAIQPAETGTKKVVIATNIAESSLTIEGIQIVIDSGLARVLRYDSNTGLSSLETIRASKANIDQRRGRAGRIEPGLCIRLWNEAQTNSLPNFANPEILEADLTELVLVLANWGINDSKLLSFIDSPPENSWTKSVELLRQLDALDDQNRLTKIGKELSKLPIHPRLAHMILESVKIGRASTAANIAVILSEKGLGGNSADLRNRLITFLTEKSIRAIEAKRLAKKWVKSVGSDFNQIDEQVEDAGKILCMAYPDRIAQARGSPGSYRLANGRGAVIEPDNPLFGEPLLSIAELQSTASRSKIILASPILKSDIESLFHNKLCTEEVIRVTDEGEIIARIEKKLNKLVINSENTRNPNEEKMVGALLNHIRKTGLKCLPFQSSTRNWCQRITYLHRLFGDPWPDLSGSALQESLSDWLGPFLLKKRAVSEISGKELKNALELQVPGNLHGKLSELAPSHFALPTGKQVEINYSAEAGPTISVRVQELFGLKTQPCLASGKLPLVLELLSPAHRPIQITKDLPSFWKGSWQEVKTEMKGRYPKHFWPEDPANSQPTQSTKKRM